eukprot:scaffold418_cov386-Prasinococcus_capsulatus_cf.AAC.11
MATAPFVSRETGAHSRETPSAPPRPSRTSQHLTRWPRRAHRGERSAAASASMRAKARAGSWCRAVGVRRRGVRPPAISRGRGASAAASAAGWVRGGVSPVWVPGAGAGHARVGPRHALASTSCRAWAARSHHVAPATEPQTTWATRVRFRPNVSSRHCWHASRYASTFVT